MPSRVQVESQGDAAIRDAALRGGPLPFIAGGLRPNVKPEGRLQAKEMRPKLKKGFMRGPQITGFMRTLAEAFQAQRRR